MEGLRSSYLTQEGHSSFFAHALNPTIGTGMFTAAQGDVHIHTQKSGHSAGFEELYKNVAPGAFYDAAERVDPPKCHPHTRRAVLAEIIEWVKQPDNRRQFIMWLYGPAGAGKSAIAQTIAEMCAKEGFLAACFFFSRTAARRNDTSCFMASIAYQLSLSIPEIHDRITTAVEKDPLVFSRTLSAQMEILIVRPINALVDVDPKRFKSYPRFIIVDGLDECGDGRSQKDILDVLAASVSQLHIPLIFLVASRPEYAIRQAFNMEPLRMMMHGLALDENYHPDADIHIFLQSKFDEIKRNHPSGSELAQVWPTETEMKYLVEKSSGQFIYASTVIKYIDSPRHIPSKRLKIILGLSSPGKETPFAQLDALYHLILASVDNVPRVLELLSLLILQLGYSNTLTVDLTEDLLAYDRGEVHAALTDMHALIRVPETGPLRIHHASLQDFLMDRSRSGELFIDAQIGHANIARHWLRYSLEISRSTSSIEGLFNRMKGFMDHYLKSCLSEELANDLANLNLEPLLSRISIEQFYYAPWGNFFNCLRTERSGDPQIDQVDVSRLLDQLDTWIRDRLAQYPDSVQSCIPAVFSISQSPEFLVPDIFTILIHDMAPSEIQRLRKLDEGLFDFDRLHYRVNLFHGKNILGQFFTDASRAGRYFANASKCANLAWEISERFFEGYREERAPLPREEAMDPNGQPVQLPEERSYRLSSLITTRRRIDDSDRIPYLELEFPKLKYFYLLLGNALKDPELAIHLRERALQFSSRNVLCEGRRNMALASLRYINECHVPYLQHAHRPNCDVCIICESLQL